MYRLNNTEEAGKQGAFQASREVKGYHDMFFRFIFKLNKCHLSLSLKGP